MFSKIFAAIFAWFVTLSSLFTGQYADRMPEEHQFPIIGNEQQQEGTVRVMSFNVRCTDVNGVPASMRRMIATQQILETAPDSLGVQEATPEWMSYLKRNLYGYASVGVGREGGNKGEYSAVFYNKARWTVEDSGTFWLSETPDTVSIAWDAACIRICTWAVLKNRETGEKYVHINSHFDHVSDLARANSAKMVNDFSMKFSGLPVVFTADMNSTPGGSAYKEMSKVFRDTRLEAEDIKSYGTFHAANPDTYADYIIDYILCSGNIEIKTYRTVTEGINGRFVSDHFPIYSDMVFNGVPV